MNEWSLLLFSLYMFRSFLSSVARFYLIYILLLYNDSQLLLSAADMTLFYLTFYKQAEKNQKHSELFALPDRILQFMIII